MAGAQHDVGEAGALQHQPQLDREVHRLLQRAFLLGHELAVAPHLRADLEGHALRQRVDVGQPNPQLVVGAVGRAAALPLGRPRLGKLPFLLGPVAPVPPVRVRHLLVENEEAARLEVLVEASERLDVVLTRPADAEAAADDDRPVPPRQVELVQRLRVQAR